MVKRKLILEEDYFDDEAVLIALHSTTEFYKIAYRMNSILRIRLSLRRTPVEVIRKDMSLTFPLYYYRDEYKDLNFYLVKNKFSKNTSNNMQKGLFIEEYSTYFGYLIPERRDVDGFIKIEGAESAKPWIAAMNQKIKGISTMYALDIKTLKSNKNLIFE